MRETIESTANFDTGHVKVTTRAYSENSDQLPIDLALLGVDTVVKKLQADFPDIEWVERIRFAGILDFPDKNGLTRFQGHVTGMAISLLRNNDVLDRIGVSNRIYKGRFPQKTGEILMSNELFEKMNLKIGDKLTLISTTMFGDLSMCNFNVSGTILFGISALDKGMIIADITDVRNALNMENASAEILGFFNNKHYEDFLAKSVSQKFNLVYKKSVDKYTPIMKALSDQNDMAFIVAYTDILQLIIVLVFVLAMSIVLWNAGLIVGLRRYGEFGLRLAIGESKHELYKILLLEAFIIGLIASLIGELLGVAVAFYFQKVGVDYGEVMKDTTFLMPSVLRAQVTSVTYYIGFLPGLFSTIIGSMLAGIAIYKRQTATLFKELEN